MTLSPFFTAIESFNQISVPAAVGGSGLGGGSAAINATIQLPQFTITSVQTTVTVPDGGTVLLGGVKRLQEDAERVRRPGTLQGAAVEPSLPEHRHRPPNLEPDAHGHTPDHHPRGRGGTPGDSDDRPLTRIETNPRSSNLDATGRRGKPGLSPTVGLSRPGPRTSCSPTTPWAKLEPRSGLEAAGAGRRTRSDAGKGDDPRCPPCSSWCSPPRWLLPLPIRPRTRPTPIRSAPTRRGRPSATASGSTPRAAA